MRDHWIERRPVDTPELICEDASGPSANRHREKSTGTLWLQHKALSSIKRPCQACQRLDVKGARLLYANLSAFHADIRCPNCVSFMDDSAKLPENRQSLRYVSLSDGARSDAVFFLRSIAAMAEGLAETADRFTALDADEMRSMWRWMSQLQASIVDESLIPSASQTLPHPSTDLRRQDQ